MEFPKSKQGEVSHNNSIDIAQAFLDNERGDTNENISSKNDVKDFISSQSGNEKQKLTGIGDETKNNITVVKTGEKKILSDKELPGNDIHSFNNVSNDQEKHNELIETNNKESSSEEDKFKDLKSSNENYEKEFKKNEIVAGNSEKIVFKGEKSDDSQPGKSDEEKEEWMDILGTGQLKKKTLTPGTPNSRPQKSDVCEITIVGKLENGTIFEEYKSLEINLGDNETVQGLDFAMALMDDGEEAEVVIAPRFGFGSLGNKPLVPPDATLYYHVKLLNVKQEPLIGEVPINERIAIGCRKKERGNWWYTRDEHTLAIHSYRRALDYLDDTDLKGDHTEEEIQLLLEERLKTYNNLGVSQMKISAYDAALLSIDKVLNCQPKNVKALFRKSRILKEKGELQKSIDVIRQALTIEPDSKSLKQEYSNLLAAQRLDNSKQRDLYKKMMGNSLKDTDSDKKDKTSNNNNTYKLLAAFSLAVAVIGAVVFKYRL